MKKQRYVPRPQSTAEPAPFRSADEAWFWYIRSQKARRDGLRHAGSGLMARPCESDDIYLVAKNLVRTGVLTPQHLKTLLIFGVRERAPDSRLRNEELAARLWDEALDRMVSILRIKGIIE